MAINKYNIMFSLNKPETLGIAKVLADLRDDPNNLDLGFTLHRTIEKFTKHYHTRRNMICLNVYDAELILYFKDKFPNHIIIRLQYNLNNIKESMPKINCEDPRLLETD